MGIYVTGYTEARVDGKWVCIDFWQPDENGKYHHVPCIEGQSMVAQALEDGCQMENIWTPEDLSERVREMCLHKDGTLIGTKQMDGRPWHMVPGSWFTKADLNQPEYCGFFPRQMVADYLANPDGIEINEDEMLFPGEYTALDEESKKGYQYFEYTPQWGSRTILRRMKRNVLARVEAYHDRTYKDITLSDVRVLLTIW